MAGDNPSPAFATKKITGLPKIIEKQSSILDSEVKVMTCNCKQGACHQLYCICLKNGAACNPDICQCSGCQNDERESAVKARSNQIYKIESAVRKGCNCKSNYCKKNYCICHSKGQLCDPELCHCKSCYNKLNAGPVPSKISSEGKM